MSIPVHRRRFLQAIAGAPLVALTGCGLPTTRDTVRPRTRITVTGQALMEHPLCTDSYAGLADVVAEIGRGDVAFTDLEVVIKTEGSGAATRHNEFFHAAGPAVLECLSDMGFDMLALSNNHAWDLGTAGILATRDAVAAAGFAYAGTGANLDEASAAGYHGVASRVALVAAASGKVPDGAAATRDRPGVSELRLSADDRVHRGDARRILRAIETAALGSDYVIAYLHNHQWGGDMTRTRQWVRDFAQDCIRAGADVYVSHGAPLLHGIEIFQGKPILHGLGSLVFHSRTAAGYYQPEVWQSAIVHLEFDGGELQHLEAVPISLNEIGDDADHHLETRGRPRIATGTQATEILQRLMSLSASLGTSLQISGNRLTSRRA